MATSTEVVPGISSAHVSPSSCPPCAAPPLPSLESGQGAPAQQTPQLPQRPRGGSWCPAESWSHWGHAGKQQATGMPTERHGVGSRNQPTEGVAHAAPHASTQAAHSTHMGRPCKRKRLHTGHTSTRTLHLPRVVIQDGCQRVLDDLQGKASRQRSSRQMKALTCPHGALTAQGEPRRPRSYAPECRRRCCPPGPSHCTGNRTRTGS